MQAAASHTTADITIIGAGIVGLSLGLLLSRQGLQVRLVEQRASEHLLRHNPHARALALAYPAISLFKTLDIFQHIPDPHPIQTVEVSSQGQLCMTELQASDIACTAFGYMINAQSLQSQLLQACLASNRIDVIDNVADVQLDNQPDQVCIQLTQKNRGLAWKSLACFVCDGTNSTGRMQLGIHAQEREFAHVALSATIEVSKPRYGHAYERFLPDGPLGVLPVADNRYAIVWCIEKGRARTLIDCTPAQFIAHLQRQFGYRLGRIRSVYQRKCGPLKHVWVDKPILGRCLLMGNAAHSLHPAAAQGLNLSLRDVHTLAALLPDYWPERRVSDLFADYLRVRQREQANVASVTHGLVDLFSSRAHTLSFARDLGLAACALPAVRRFVAQQATFGQTMSAMSHQTGAYCVE